MPNKIYIMNVDQKLLRLQRQSFFKVRSMDTGHKEGLMSLLEHVDDVTRGIPVIRGILHFDATIAEQFGEDLAQGGYKFYYHYLVEAANELDAIALVEGFMSTFFDDGEDLHAQNEEGEYHFYDGQNKVWLDGIKQTTPEAFLQALYEKYLIKDAATGDEINRVKGKSSTVNR